jgi:hypothetical protein
MGHGAHSVRRIAVYLCHISQFACLGGLKSYTTIWEADDSSTVKCLYAWRDKKKRFDITIQYFLSDVTINTRQSHK